jgi:hypothetical protein
MKFEIIKLMFFQSKLWARTHTHTQEIAGPLNACCLPASDKISGLYVNVRKTVQQEI